MTKIKYNKKGKKLKKEIFSVSPSPCALNIFLREVPGGLNANSEMQPALTFMQEGTVG